jgi:hypothetical protein
MVYRVYAGRGSGDGWRESGVLLHRVAVTKMRGLFVAWASLSGFVIGVVGLLSLNIVTIAFGMFLITLANKVYGGIYGRN